MKDEFKDAMVIIGASALMSVVITWVLLENTNLNEKGYAVVFLIIWAMMGLILSVMTDAFNKWQE